MLVLNILGEPTRGTDINGDKMKRLLPNAVPITSNYEEITFWEEIIKISNYHIITWQSKAKQSKASYKKWGGI
jgi:hypothetical protein